MVNVIQAPTNLFLGLWSVIPPVIRSLFIMILAISIIGYIVKIIMRQCMNIFQLIFQMFPVPISWAVLGLFAILIIFIAARLVKIVLDALPFVQEL